MMISPNLEPVFERTSEFSRLYTARFLVRSLDLLHLAAEHVTSCVIP